MKLTDMNLLAGSSEEITISDFRSRPGDILTQVQLGRTFTITKNGKPVATLAQPELNAFELGAAARAAGIQSHHQRETCNCDKCLAWREARTHGTNTKDLS